MLRKPLISLIDKYTPTFSEEFVYKEQILEFIKEHPKCFERSCQLGHITASCFLLNYNETKALLMHHAKLDIWVQPGGHCDGDSGVLSVAIKEAQEESGIENIVALSNEIYDIDIHLIPANKNEMAHYHYDVRFLLKVGSEDCQVVQNQESKSLKWFDIDHQNLPTTKNSVTRLFDHWKRR